MKEHSKNQEKESERIRKNDPESIEMFEIHETKTYEVIDNVKNQKSEIGVLYWNDYNRTVLEKIFHDTGLVFTPLFDCGIYAYMRRKSRKLQKNMEFCSLLIIHFYLRISKIR